MTTDPINHRTMKMPEMCDNPKCRNYKGARLCVARDDKTNHVIYRCPVCHSGYLKGVKFMTRYFTKKPIKIEAMKWTGKNLEEIEEWAGRKFRQETSLDGKHDMCLTIITHQDVFEGYVGDWIIKENNSRFYPCKPDEFNETYIEITCPCCNGEGIVYDDLHVCNICNGTGYIEDL